MHATIKTLLAAAVTTLALAGAEVHAAKSSSSTTVDFNEKTHLIFMREEEKLARDVYTFLGQKWPAATVFGNIDDSEQQHTTTVKNMLAKYSIPDPNTNDNTGVFTGADYGAYFTEKYNLLTDWGNNSELDALYVGAFIEELDMQDIMQCPKAVVDIQAAITTTSQCGLVYTDNTDIKNMYNSLLDGSKNHLRSYVGNIEAVIGVGNYQAQVLTQAEVNTILGR